MGMSLRKSLILGVIAEESSKTKKAREKLKSKLDAAEKKLKNQPIEKSLGKKSQEIAKWIERHSQDRLTVKKDISLFDQNRNSAKMSRNIEKRAEELASELKKR